MGNVSAGNGERVFLRAEWRYLVMLNYDIDAGLLQPLVPSGTSLDLWQGRALVSVVGFRFLRTQVAGIAVPLHGRFDEVNLRFYVRRELPDGEVRRGVVFVRELVARPAIALVARWRYNEPYRVMRMRSVAPAGRTDAPGRLIYEARLDGGWHGVAATATGAATVPAADSEPAFIANHYWGYTRQRDGGTVEYAVHHPAWRTWSAAEPRLSTGMRKMYGDPFNRALAAEPVSAFIADGSVVTVSRPRRLAGRETDGATPGAAARPQHSAHS
ncbi:MAG: YqjF family protein [Gemmatimonadaceae bacterium]